MCFFIQGPLKCDVYTRRCLKGNCTLEYDGKEHSIHFWSCQTCAGDEIGWDFISSVKSSKISFTSFCNEMTRKYVTTNALSVPFMSANTFVKWIFSWMSSMQIDFRKQIDPWCAYTPKVLACDGTHIGVSLRHLVIDDTVTKTDLPADIVEPKHKR